jgi:septum formation protein
VAATTPTNRGEARLILASASPRRRELLALLGARYETIASDAEERDDPVPGVVLDALPPLALPRATHPCLLAWRKANHAATMAAGAVILGADTIVVLDGEVMNKPRDDAHARQMLIRLSGRAHTVYTGLCVMAPAMTDDRRPTADEKKIGSIVDGRWSFAFELVASEVEVAPLGADVIAGYVATGEPRDKAGAYGIQGLGGRLVRGVRGSYTAVVGLPLPAAYRMLRGAGVDGLHDPEETYLRWLAQQGKEPLPCPPTLP